MKEIKRYMDVLKYDDGDIYSGIEEFKEGELVKYTDHKAVVDNKDEELNIVKELNTALKNLVEAMQKRIDELDKYNNKILAELKDYFMYQEQIRNMSEEQSNLKWELYMQGLTKFDN